MQAWLHAAPRRRKVVVEGLGLFGWSSLDAFQVGCTVIVLLFGPLCDTGVAQSLVLQERWRASGFDLASVAGMVESEDGRILVSDPRNATVISFDSTGRFQRVWLRPGDGPGEVRGPQLLARVPTGSVLLLDVGHGSIEVFDQHLAFRRRVPLQPRITNPKGMVAIGNDEALISGWRSGATTVVHSIDSTGGTRASWIVGPSTRNPRAASIIAGGALGLGPSGEILFTQASPHAIHMLSPGDSSFQVIVSDPRVLPIVGDQAVRVQGTGTDRRVSFWWSFPRSVFVHSLPGGMLLNVVLFEDEGYTIWEIYDRSGRQRASQRVTKAYMPWSVTANGDLLCSYETEEGVPVAARVSLTLQGMAESPR